jgi:hypothetical protein
LELIKEKEKTKMKNLILLMMVVIVSSFAISCSPSVPQNSFRVTSKRDLRVFGIPLGIKIKNPFVFLNLRTPTSPGPTTTGSVNEFNPGGQYINTGANATFDAVDAVLPAQWTIRAAPLQVLCANNTPITVGAVRGAKYDFDCVSNVSNILTTTPDLIDVSYPNTPPNSITGNVNKSFSSFKMIENLRVHYYRQVAGDDYEAAGVKPAISIAPNGRSVQIPLPTYTPLTSGAVNYRALFAEEGSDDYIGHLSFTLFHGDVEELPCWRGGFNSREECP